MLSLSTQTFALTSLSFLSFTNSVTISCEVRMPPPLIPQRLTTKGTHYNAFKNAFRYYGQVTLSAFPSSHWDVFKGKE